MNIRSLVLHGWRSWQRARGIALLAVAALALGIGSTTAIYTLVQGVLLNPLPYADADRYYSVLGGWRGRPERNAFSYQEANDFAARVRTTEAFGCYAGSSANLTFNGQPVHASGTQISPALARSLGVEPRMGRWFGDAPGGAAAANATGALNAADDAHLIVLSTPLWQRLGADPAIVGKTITIDGGAYAVTGVMPASFQFPVGDTGDFWTPLNPDAGQRARRGYRYLLCAAKRQAAVSPRQLDEDLQRILGEFRREHPDEGGSERVVVAPLLSLATESIRPTLVLLLGAAGVLLLITCANVASLLLTRAVARARETAVRLALGSSIRQLGAQHFVEGLMVAGGGALLGVLASWWLLRLMLSMAADEIPRADRIVTDGRVLAFTLVVTIASALLCSLAPLWHARRAPLVEVLGDGARSSAGARSRGTLRLFVIVQMALACGLVAIGAGLLRHLDSLRHAPLGFDADHIMTLQVVTPAARYQTQEALAAHQARLLEAFRAIPGVEQAGFASKLPLSGMPNATKLWLEGTPEPSDAASPPLDLTFVSPGYFHALGVPLVQGRFFTDADREDRTSMALLVNEAAARRFWPKGDPIGAPVRLSSWMDGRFIVAGIVADVRNVALGQPTRPEVYLSFRQVAPAATRWVVRSRLDGATLTRALRTAAAGVDPEQAIYDERPMRDTIAGTLVRQRLQSFVVAFFALSALLLAVLGVYGVVSYAVRQRAAELGTRMALGATARHVMGLVIGDGLRMAAIGIALGLLAVLVLLRAAVSASTLDLPAATLAPLATAAALIATLTALACLVPGWHAASLSPLLAMRNESDTLWSRARGGYRRMATHLSTRVATLVAPSQGDERELALLSGIAASSRQAGSFAEAIDLALATLRETLDAEHAILLVAANDAGAAGTQAGTAANTSVTANANPTANTSTAAKTRTSASAGTDSHATANLHASAATASARTARPLRCAGVSPAGDRRDWTLPSDALILRRLRHLSAALPLSHGDLESWFRWTQAHAPSHRAEMETLLAMNAALAAPVAVGTDGPGLLLLGPPRGRAAYSAAERLAVHRVGAQLALLIENSRLTDRIVEQERLRRELQLAADVQRRLFPETLPQTAAVRCGGVCLPARGVGGDYYDFIDLPEGRLGIALADVAGKGIAAALVMSVVQATLRSLAEANGASPAPLAGMMNRLLHQSTSANSYATFFYAQFDPVSRELRYVNAGHNPPYVVRQATGAIEALTVGGTVLGMFPHWDYDEASVTLEAGDVLVAFTDGVVEAHDAAEEEFGEERLQALLRRTAALPASEMVSAMLDDLRAWMGDAAQYDDLTFIVVQVR